MAVAEKKAKVTPFMEQYLKVKEDHEDKLVLFRMGDFYEVFYEDAKLASSILGITLTARGAKSANPTPMAGIPFHALNDYLPRLIEHGCRVAICDQVEDPATAKGLVKREVVRIVTKGTLTEESLLEPGKNNFLMSIAPQGANADIAWLDFSTGEVFVRSVDKNRVVDAITTIAPSELLVARSFEKTELAATIKANCEINTVNLEDWHFGSKSAIDKIKKVYQIDNLNGLGLSEESHLIKPLGALLEYITQTQLTDKLYLRKVQTVHSETYMILDRQTCRNLEIFQNQQDGSVKGSLYDTLNQTMTPMGARKLGSWLAQPLLSKTALLERQNIVSAFYKLDTLKDFRNLLKDVKDIERPLTRIRCGRFSARDMRSIALSLSQVPGLNQCLSSSELLSSQKITELNTFSESILKQLKEELPFGIQDGEMIATGIDEDLDSWREIRGGGQKVLTELQEKLKVELELPGLKVRHNKVFGYYIEVPKAQSARVPENFIRKQTLVNAERYIIPELKEFEDKIFNAQGKILEIELKLIQNIRDEFMKVNDEILKVSGQLSEMDVLSTFAFTALEYGYHTVNISEIPCIQLEQSRHPVVERLMGSGSFTANDVDLEREKTRMMLITGPNMSGKSTFIRQVGLIQIMFQLGSFVPAKEATLSICDRVFTRIGAGDDLSSGRSTFMVEMNETANILHNATPRSLVILDEVGRGTSTLDGLSLAWAISEALHNQTHLSPLSLFATHYHEMTELEKKCEHLKNFQIQVEENDKNIIFLHKIVAGGADKSYGIHVAKLAGLPDSVIKRANSLLDHFEGNEVADLSSLPEAELETDAGFLFSLPESNQNKNEVLTKLSEVDPDEITPLQALIFLKELKECSESYA